MEYLGEVTGKKNIQKCFEYLNESAKFNHPASLWMLAHLMIKKEVSDNVDYSLVWEYLNKAYKLGSIASINTMGICYLKGWTKEGIRDEKKALECFMEASRYNYVYSLNNLGMYYEKKDSKKAFEYYLKSANLKDSWACNKVGRIYLENKELSKAYNYFILGSESSLNEICHYNNYNLVKYFYLPGCSEIMITKDLNKSIDLLEQESNYLIEAKILLLEIYISKYLSTKDNLYLDKINIMKNKIELDSKYNNEIKTKIEKDLETIKKTNQIMINFD